MDLAILERAAVLAAARRLLAGVTRGRGGTLFVAGEPGLGKTTVLDHVVAAAAGDFRVGTGRGDVAEALLPFGLHYEGLLGRGALLAPVRLAAVRQLSRAAFHAGQVDQAVAWLDQAVSDSVAIQDLA